MNNINPWFYFYASLVVLNSICAGMNLVERNYWTVALNVVGIVFCGLVAYVRFTECQK